MERKHSCSWKWLRLLLLLLAAFPLRGAAQKVNLPFVCIEKTNGEVEKVLITDSSPNMCYGTYFDEELDKPVTCLIIKVNDDFNCDIYIPFKDIKRMYSRFEEVDAVAYLKADGITQTADVFNVGGVRVGSVGQLSQLPRGVYLVKKGSKTIKIVNK